MTSYQQAIVGNNLSQLVLFRDVQDEAMRSMERGSVTPSIKPTGLLWQRTNHPTLGNSIDLWTGSAWQTLIDFDFAQVNVGGTIAFAANQPMGGFKLTGLAAGTASGDSMRFEQGIQRDGSLAMTGDLDLGTHEIVNLAEPSGDDSAATKAYVDSKAGNFYFQTSLDAAGNGKPLVTTIDATPDSEYNDCGFVPRSLRLQLYGKLKRQDNSFVNGTAINVEYDVAFWDEIRGYTNPTLLANVPLTTDSVNISVRLKTTDPKGFYIDLVNATGHRMDLVDPSNTAQVGSIQCIARSES